MGDTSSFIRQNPIGHTEFLLDRARAGSQAAWHEIFKRYRTMLVVQIQVRIRGFARRRFDADDVLQTALAKAWGNISSFEYRGEGSFRRWLATLVLHEFQNELRAQCRELDHRAPDEHDSQLAELTDEAAVHREALAQARISTLEKLGELDEDDRDILTMRHFEDMSFDAIAQVLECSRARARQNYTLALGRLARRLGS